MPGWSPLHSGHHKPIQLSSTVLHPKSTSFVHVTAFGALQRVWSRRLREGSSCARTDREFELERIVGWLVDVWGGGLKEEGVEEDEEEGVSGATQDGRAVDTLSEHLTLAREYALLGSYDTAFIFFEGVLAQINK
ncbi:hypothetical protein M758_7G043400 [Ceratodon purpureus]|nr:hypothetical protein M758_7G043400 [Ceratodon purpureus]